jgi:hypothetical protein
MPARVSNFCAIWARPKWLVYVPGDRPKRYEPVAEVPNLATRFLQGQIVPHLHNGLERLDRISDLVKQMPLEERARVSARAIMLRSWEKRGRKFLPMVLKLMSG